MLFYKMFEKTKQRYFSDAVLNFAINFNDHVVAIYPDASAFIAKIIYLLK